MSFLETSQCRDGCDDGPVNGQQGAWRDLVAAVRQGDDQAIERALLALSRRNRLLAPLGFLVGAFLMLFQGVKLLVTNWRLTLIQVLPATLIWAAMLDLKVHALKGRSFNVLRGPVLIPLVLAIVLLAAGAYYLNAVFAFYVSRRTVGKKTEDFRPAFTEAFRHRRTILAWGLLIGLALGFATTVAPRWGRGWFSLLLGVVVAVMMLTYVTVPAALVGVRSERTPREQITTSAVGGAMGAVLCSPPYALGRLGIILLGSSSLFALGLALIIVAVPLQAGAVSATKAVKVSSKLLAGLGDASESGSHTATDQRSP
jgi:hypothetical protein